MGLTADRQPRTRATAAKRTRGGDIAAGVIIYKGAIIAKNATGYVVPASDAAAIKVVGVAENFYDNTLGADGAAVITYTTGVDVELVNSAGGAAVVQAGKHELCYVADDQTVQALATSAHRVIAGQVTTFTAALVWVHVDEQLAAGGGATLVNGAVSPAVITAGALQVIPIDIPDAATQTLAYLNADKIEIVDVVLIKDTAGAGNTVQLKDGTGTAISDAIVYAVDKTVTRAGTLDKAKRTLAAGAGFQLTVTRAAGSAAGQAFLHVIKRT